MRYDFKTVDMKESVTVHHSNLDSTEDSCTVIDTLEIEKGQNRYQTRLVVAEVRYEIILGITWHNHIKPVVDYIKRSVKIGDEKALRKCD